MRRDDSLDAAFGYQPALDGVRALAVAAVLGFHLEVSWLTGGYLGVSVFFTLSGYLITSLLIHEHDRRGMVDLPGFYQRRARRLVPAGLLVLFGVCVLAAAGVIQVRSTFQRDIVAAMLQVLNWVHLFGDQSYADLFKAPSPVTHYWSLGIEEQFYLVWPLLLVLILRHLRRRAVLEHLLWWMVALWVLAAASAPLSVRWWSHDGAYYATWARAAELLPGAVLAVGLRGRRLPRGLGLLVPLVLAAMGFLVVVTPAGRGWAFDGYLPLFGLLSAALVVGLQVDSPARRMLSSLPVVWVGRLSYGLYLFHWPVFLVLDKDRMGFGGVGLVAVRLSVTLALAVMSYYLLERRVRERRLWRTGRRLTIAMASCVALVAAVAIVVVRVPTAPAAAQTVISVAPTSEGATSDTESAPTVITVFGDSIAAWLLRDGAMGYDRTDAVIINGAIEGCDGMVDRPLARLASGEEVGPPEDCVEWNTWYPHVIDQMTPLPGTVPDVALLVFGVEPVLDHEVAGRWIGPCTDLEWYLSDVAARIDYLRGRGVFVVYAMPSPLGEKSVWIEPADHRQRMDCVRSDLGRLMSSLQVPVVDLQEILCPANDCDAVRQVDGVHIDPPYAPEVLDWLITQGLAASGR